MSEKLKVGIVVEEKLWNAFKTIVNLQGKTISEVLEQLIKQYVRNHKAVLETVEVVG